MRSIRLSASTLRMAWPSAGDADPEAFLGQRARDQIADLAMVIDDQDVRRARHAGEYRRPRRRGVA